MRNKSRSPAIRGHAGSTSIAIIPDIIFDREENEMDDPNDLEGRVTKLEKTVGRIEGDVGQIIPKVGKIDKIEADLTEVLKGVKALNEKPTAPIEINIPPSQPIEPPKPKRTTTKRTPKPKTEEHKDQPKDLLSRIAHWFVTTKKEE